MEIAIGHFLKLSLNNITYYKFQNFFIQEQISYNNDVYTFTPFGFSGVTVNRTGDNTEASLLFPNSEISRAWATEALQNQWLAHVQVLIVDPASHLPISLLHQYYGKTVSGTWDEVNLTVYLSTVLDAVGTDIPTRYLTQSLIGKIPVTSNVQLQ
jgi:hypothetical protein